MMNGVTLDCFQYRSPFNPLTGLAFESDHLLVKKVKKISLLDLHLCQYGFFHHQRAERAARRERAGDLKQSFYRLTVKRPFVLYGL